MRENCGCKIVSKLIQYKYQYKDEDCSFGTNEFEKESKSIPYCCRIPMKCVK